MSWMFILGYILAVIAYIFFIVLMCRTFIRDWGQPRRKGWIICGVVVIALGSIWITAITMLLVLGDFS